MKIYTKTGDKCMNSLVGGKRVEKDDARVQAYGILDELQSFVGMLASVTDEVQLADVQRILFKIGGYLASEDATSAGVPDETIAQLEQWIDRLSEELSPLRTFIIPGGAMAASICHVCRTVCRRAERRMITLRRTVVVGLDDNAFIYINRLSDYFFLLARKLNKVAGKEDVTL